MGLGSIPRWAIDVTRPGVLLGRLELFRRNLHSQFKYAYRLLHTVKAKFNPLNSPLDLVTY